ncbi:unnamed protein product [Coffea canephora]|uniref:DH200=94 genomic scaffold, scaffold_1777 n=1 Tax=Coffea canephora TaxID=49390 RepID=A0A068VM97_COFCA|nr:unnamed protein product [Coffea canephora]
MYHILQKRRHSIKRNKGTGDHFSCMSSEFAAQLFIDYDRIDEMPLTCVSILFTIFFKKLAARSLEPAFQRAGQRLGTEIWRIENFQPILLRKSDHRKFYLGDSYIVLQVHIASNISSFVSYFGPHFYELSVYD